MTTLPGRGGPDPLSWTRLAPVPPAARSRRAHLYTRAAAEGRFALQRCSQCGTFAYPARDACPTCLSADLPVVDAPQEGTVVAETTVRVSPDAYFRERTPWRVGIVRLACGPTMVAHLHGDCRDGARVRMSFQLDKSGNAVAFARPAEAGADVAQDRQWREMTVDPKLKRALVTDGRNSVGQEVALALVRAGAATVYVGIDDPAKPFEGEAHLRALPAVRIVALDIADESSTAALGAEIGDKIDILVNTTEHVRPGGLLTRHGTGAMDGEFELTQRGFVRLAQAFGPALREHRANDAGRAAAWVNILSVYALVNWPAFGAYSASHAAMLSLSQCLRSELGQGGVKVVNVFSGPTETVSFQAVPPPKVPVRTLAAAVVRSLAEGVEDAFVGEIATDIRRRLQVNPKAVERELGP